MYQRLLVSLASFLFMFFIMSCSGESSIQFAGDVDGNENEYSEEDTDSILRGDIDDYIDGDIDEVEVEIDGDTESNNCDGCLIDNICIAKNDKSTQIACAVCDPARNPDDWSPIAADADIVCREAKGVCDLAEVCDGNALECPSDNFAADTTECRESAGVCDVAEFCAGDSVECPADDFAADTTECRESAGVCDVAEFCAGDSVECPADDFLVETTVCREADDSCDAIEYCTGFAAYCPNDKVMPTTNICRFSAGVCDVDEVCDGINKACPDDEFLEETTICREADGSCDAVEYCTGFAALCPIDRVLPATNTCRLAADTCDVSEYCDGQSNSCPDDEFVDDGSLCGDDDQCVSGKCMDCYDDAGCADMFWGDRVDECSSRVCGTDNTCEFNDKADGLACGTGDQCLAGECRDCYDNSGCSDWAWGSRVDECSDRVCGSENTCEFDDEADGIACGTDDQCLAGECLDCYDSTGCTDFAWGERDPACSDRVCNAQNNCEFNDAEKGSECGTGDQCDQGICADCIDINGCSDHAEDANPCTDLMCDNHSCTDVNDDTNSCELGFDCSNDHCVDGVCEVETVTNGCLIENTCIAEGISQDQDGCVACNPQADTRNWSNMDGTVCAQTDDGNPCTDNICAGGTCIAQNDDSNTCYDDLGCTNSSCIDGVCIVTDTYHGCYISGACYSGGSTEANTGNGSCQACDSNSSWNSWTVLDSGSCDDDNSCTSNDTCSGGLCSGTSYSCNDHGTCNSDDDICTCAEGYEGDYCDKCLNTYRGYPDCQPFNTPDFVPISAGSFWMGSPDDEDPCPEDYAGGDCTSELGRDTDEKLHHVTLTYDFEIDKYEATQGDFETITGWNSNFNSQTPDEGSEYPATYVSWFDALAYANMLSIDAGLKPCYSFSDVKCENSLSAGNYYAICLRLNERGIRSATISLNGVNKPQECEGYRLPTEAEWEYAIRAETNTAFYNGAITELDINVIDPNLVSIGWYYAETSSHFNAIGGQKQPNSRGIYDMSGNVKEWNWDVYRTDYNLDVTIDPVGLEVGFDRVVRNCSSYFEGSGYCRSASRQGYPPYSKYQFLGFRLVRTLPRIP